MKTSDHMRHPLRPIAVWSLWGIVLVSLTGCAAPRRTFVAESARPQKTNTAPEPASKAVPPTAEPSEIKPSMWSKLVGSLSPMSAPQSPTKPAERIPLPRTDGKAAGSEIPAEQPLENSLF